jgi:hypothetical protein
MQDSHAVPVNTRDFVKKGMIDPLIEGKSSEVKNGFIDQIMRIKPMNLTMVHKGRNASKHDNEVQFKKTLEFHHLVGLVGLGLTMYS